MSSQFRVQKRRAEAELTLSGGTIVRGWFFLAESAAMHAGPERVADLLNAERGLGFFPFEPAGGSADDTILVNRAHVIMVKLLEQTNEPQADPGYEVATERHVVMRLSNGASLTGAVRVYCPQGRDRLSDYAHLPETFRYVESPEGVFVVNSAYIVNLKETAA